MSRFFHIFLNAKPLHMVLFEHVLSEPVSENRLLGDKANVCRVNPSCGKSGRGVISKIVSRAGGIIVMVDFH